MTNLTKEEMLTLMLEHELAELEFDVPRTMRTLVPDPHYEIATLGVAVDGWDTVETTYKRLVNLGAKDRNIQAVARVIAEAENTLIREAHVSFDMPDGKRVTGLYLVVLEFDPETKKIRGERMYTDPVFGQLLTETLGEDYATLPGVTSLSDGCPIIDRHDAWDDAEARGIKTNNPREKA